MNKKTRRKLDKLNKLIDKGYTFSQDLKSIEACQCWLKAWELVKEIKAPDTHDIEDFSYTYYHYLDQEIAHWVWEFASELHNAGLTDPSFHKLRIEHVEDHLQTFPDTIKSSHRAVSLLRSKAEALWELGHQEEAEAEFTSMIKSYPDNAWGYIGWSDHYCNNEPTKAKRILLQALENPNLQDSLYVYHRLYDLYEKEDDVEKINETIEKIAHASEFELNRSSKPTRGIPPIPEELQYGPMYNEDEEYDDEEDDDEEYDQLIRKLERKAKPKPGRNEPCWCGSGKKYKKCHWRQDKK